MNFLSIKSQLQFFFKLSSPDEIVNFLSNNENHEFGLENLEGMLKILPHVNEVNIKFLKC